MELRLNMFSLLLLGVCGWALQACASSEAYVQYENQSGKRIIVDYEKRVFIYGDVGEELQSCGSRYKGFVTKFISFCMPRESQIKIDATWSHLGSDYFVRGYCSAAIQPSRSRCFEIEKREKEIKFTFLFSELEGIIGIEAVGGGKATYFRKIGAQP